MVRSRQVRGSRRQQRGGRLALAKKLVFALVAVVLFFSAVELILWLAKVVPRAYRDDPYVGFAKALPLFEPFTPADGSDWLATAVNKRPWFNHQAFPRVKPPGTTRIICLGGSTTYGRPYDDTTSFAGWLRALLPAAAPERRWEVINAGGISYASYRIAALLPELNQYQPDLYIVYTGHNEFLEARTFAGLRDAPGWARELGARLGHSRCYTLMADLLQHQAKHPKNILPGEVEPTLDLTVGPTSYHREDNNAPQVIAEYARNLGRIIDLSRFGGAKVLLVTPACSLRDCAPFKSEARNGATIADLQRFDQLFETARETRGSGSLQSALDHIETALAIDNRRADAHYLAAQVRDQMQRFDEAKLAYERARDEDVCPLRALSAIVSTARRVAQLRHVPLVDFVEFCERHARDGIPGADLFLDHVHPTVAANRLLATELIEAMAAEQWLTTAPSWNPQRRAEIAAKIENSLDREAHGRALTNLSKVLGWAGKFAEAERLAQQACELAPSDPETVNNLGVTCERAGDYANAERYYADAVRLDRSLIKAHYNLGLVLERQGKLSEAATRYQEALALAPKDARILNSYGITMTKMGDLEAAVKAYRRALGQRRDLADVHNNLGVVYLRLERLDEAAAAFAHALRLQPDYADAHSNLGVTRMLQSRHDEAIASLRTAMQLQPDLAKTHGLLGEALARAGQTEAARAAFQRALELQPGDPKLQAQLAALEDANAH